MKKINYKIIAVAISGILSLGGCETIQKTSSGMGSTGTGLLAGALAGAGTGVLCDKLTNGKNRTECIAAGLVVGAAAGYAAASWDESVEKSVPTMDCASVKKRMAYSASATKAKAVLTLDTSQSVLLVKPGQTAKIVFKMDLATPDVNGKSQEIPLKISMGDLSSKTPNTKGCGGDYSFPLPVSTNVEGVFRNQIHLINMLDNSQIDGGSLDVCYTVANDGVYKC